MTLNVNSLLCRQCYVLWAKGKGDIGPNELVLTFGCYYLCAKIGENRSRNATMRGAHTDRHALTQTDFTTYSSYGADNHADGHCNGAPQDRSDTLNDGLRHSDFKCGM